MFHIFYESYEAYKNINEGFWVSFEKRKIDAVSFSINDVSDSERAMCASLPEPFSLVFIEWKPFIILEISVFCFLFLKLKPNLIKIPTFHTYTHHDPRRVRHNAIIMQSHLPINSHTFNGFFCRKLIEELACTLRVAIAYTHSCYAFFSSCVVFCFPIPSLHWTIESNHPQIGH